MKKLLLVLVVLGLVAAVYLGGVVSKKAALSVTSDPSGQKVLLGNQEVGTTPFLSDQLDEGNPVLSFGNFNQKIRLTSGALSVVNWVLGPSETFSAGEVVWFSDSSTGSELLVITKPVAEVFLNGESLGDSPLSKSVEPGEYDLEMKKSGYFSRKLKISVKEGFRLNISANLALNPFPLTAKKLVSPSSNLTIWNLPLDSSTLVADSSLWVAGAVFWASRLEEPVTYHFFLTSEGKLYDAQGSEVSLSSLVKTEEKKTLGYLGEESGVLTAAARTTLNALTAKLYPTSPRVQILDTGIGYLKVRSGPGKSYSEIGRATVGSKYTYLGEQSGWYKINFGGKEGWISSDYARKL